MAPHVMFLCCIYCYLECRIQDNFKRFILIYGHNITGIVDAGSHVMILVISFCALFVAGDAVHHVVFRSILCTVLFFFYFEHILIIPFALHWLSSFLWNNLAEVSQQSGSACGTHHWGFDNGRRNNFSSGSRFFTWTRQKGSVSHKNSCKYLASNSSGYGDFIFHICDLVTNGIYA